MIKKALVTGGAGFIGSNLVDKLIELGIEVMVVDNLSTGKHENINDKASILIADIAELSADKLIEDIIKEYQIDTVFHLAAKARVQPSIKDPVDFNKHNVDGMLNVLVAAQRGGVKRFIYSASSSAYGNNPNLPLKEDMPTAPMSPYGLQKLIGEQYCKLFSDVYGIETVCLRYFNVYGERQTTEGAYCTVIGIFTGLLKSGKFLTITNDGEQKRDFTYVGDVVDANIKAALSEHVGKGEVINIGSGTNYSVNQIASFFGRPTEYIGNVLEPRETLADNSKAKSILSWEPKTNLKDWLSKYVEKLNYINT